MQNFEEQLHHDLETRAQSLVRLALGSREKTAKLKRTKKPPPRAAQAKPKRT